MRLEKKFALVTGGGSGIGRAVATLFAREGATVAVNDINEETAQKTVAELGSGLAVAADVADPDRVREMFAEVARRFDGKLDVLVNCAGIAEVEGMDTEDLSAKVQARITDAMSGQPGRTHLDVTRNLPDEVWDRMIRVHLYGTFNCTREALRLMDDGGSIVNLSSVAGLTGLAAVPHYSAAKAGILGFTRAVAQEVGSRGVRVNAICPGWIETPMTEPIPPILKMLAIGQTPLGRTGSPRRSRRRRSSSRRTRAPSSPASGCRPTAAW
jgi:3-oxoacyl-[acyl-carrier protein] reductase